MSSMRNAIQRNPHRERAQPLERRRLGLLEKHKDYSKRAQDYNKKKKQLKNLRAKAAERNEDEFYFGMMSRKGPGSKLMDGKRWSGTVQGDRGNKSMSVDAVRLLKTQDIGYVRTMRQIAQKEVVKLQEQAVLTKGLDRLDEDDDDEDEDDDDFDLPPKSMRAKPARKIVFLDTEEEQDEVVQDRLEEEDGDEEEFEGLDDDEEEGDEVDDEREKSLRRVRRQLEAAKHKLKVLTDVERELELQRAKMAKTATSGGETRRGKKLKFRTRKR
ncbi:unnamed protein product [Clonostachys byssicola]|uniref:U3 small nucleolar RNA-associated protein 11 n=1 Tax=Clonostachys byssicola TaxID=160290 RepID=A0A9N9UCC5_9HYPO|nr:unnamed protein product [Clonostachys byssicola]